MDETDFIGHFDVRPAMNDGEIDYLLDWAEHRHWDALRGPYRLQNQPGEADTTADVNRPGPGLPSLWCRWIPSADGESIVWDGDPDFDEPTAWLRYLVRHFLARGAETRGRLPELFGAFTYDHVVSGAVVGRRRHDRRMFAVKAKANRVNEQVLRLGDDEEPPTRSAGPGPSTRARADATTPPGVVIDLASRRRTSR
ncbi:hypothetical protein ABFT23_06990 [Nocardioides sp. C4-1]|uniref:hypothetical protein n=1 Tax=Nocardioides sp. C4-1 TaxID=3151851 RepID=UPI00326435D5